VWLALSPPNPPSYRDEHLFVDPCHQAVILNGEMVRLTPLQFRLLALLMEHAGEVMSTTTLLTQAWGYAPEKRTLNTTLWRLRKKLGMYSNYIETVVGVGYRFRPMPGS
jgi:DNA-binding response OmpR family regulator